MTAAGYLVNGLAAVAGAYQCVAIVACLRHRRRREPAGRFYAPVSILKPVRGLDPGFLDALRSHAEQDYPEFEVLFGVNDPADPAIPLIDQLIHEYPQVPIRLIPSLEFAPNGKVGLLITLAREARYPILVVNDSDITVPSDYLRRIVRPLANPQTGLVTCLYRASGRTLASRLECLSIATDFAPSVLVAPLFGVTEFGLGSTLAFRARHLQKIGGFEAVAEYLADDYQLGKAMADAGLKNHLSQLVVDTQPASGTWRGVWHHQIRWARTIRVSRGGGYLGLPITYAGVWAVCAALGGFETTALALVWVRYAMALVATIIVLRDQTTARDLWLVPVRDVLALVVWAVALFGRDVRWRDRRLRLRADGKIEDL